MAATAPQRASQEGLGRGYIDRGNEIIVGVQTEAPLRRAIKPSPGRRMVVDALKAYRYETDPDVVETFCRRLSWRRRRVVDRPYGFGAERRGL